MTSALFEPVLVRRRTRETDFSVRLSPRGSAADSMDVPNRILSHMIDHWSKACGVNVALTSADWPSSWEFDHVLCEDLGQLIGKGVSCIARQYMEKTGIVGRASAVCNMDDAACMVAITFESRPRCSWNGAPTARMARIDGFVDAWYAADGSQTGRCYGTNLRQFFDGFAYGSGASLFLRILSTGNLHHVYETLFRALGDAVGQALNAGRSLVGESSGLAGAPDYEVSVLEENG